MNALLIFTGPSFSNYEALWNGLSLVKTPFPVLIQISLESRILNGLEGLK